MNAITIQKRSDGKLLITSPQKPTLIWPLIPQAWKNIFPILEPLMAELPPEPDDFITTIPDRLENQGEMIQRIAEKLGCPPTDTHILGAIQRLQDNDDSKTPPPHAGFPVYEEIQKIQKQLREKWNETMANREEILRAFIAKHGCDPDEVEQIEQPAWPGSYLRVWSVRKKVKPNSGLRVKHVFGAVPKAATDNPIFEHGKPVEFEHGGIVPGPGVQLCERCGEKQPSTATAFPVDCVHCGARLPNPVMISTREPRRTFSIREAARRIMRAARSMYIGSVVSTDGDRIFQRQAADIIEEFTGHKEKLIQELRTLWTLRRIVGEGAFILRESIGGGVFLATHNAEQIDNLLATPPVFHEPGEEDLFFRRGLKVIRDDLEGRLASMTRIAGEAQKENKRLEFDLKLACQHRAEAMLANENQHVTITQLREREQQARKIARQFILLFDL